MSCRRENFPSPAACRTKAFNKLFVSNTNLNRNHFCIFPISIRISCRSGSVFEQEYKSNPIISNPFFDRMKLHFHCRTVFQERSFVRRKLLPHRKLHSSAAFRRLCCAHFPKQRFKPALTYPISVTALSPFEYTGAVSELFSAISRPLRFGVVRSAADCINDSGGVL